MEKEIRMPWQFFDVSSTQTSILILHPRTCIIVADRKVKRIKQNSKFQKKKHIEKRRGSMSEKGRRETLTID